MAKLTRTRLPQDDAGAYEATETSDAPSEENEEGLSSTSFPATTATKKSSG
jgi:hypothetical protein